MRLKKSKNSKIFLVLTTVAVLVAGLGYLRYSSQTKNQPTTNLVGSPSPKDQNQGDPQIKRENGQVVFTDQVFNYSLDLTSIPEVEITDGDNWYPYSFEMYPKDIENLRSSIARFGLSAPKENPEGLTLQEFATKNLDYAVGKRESGWGPLITSKMTSTTVGDKYRAVNWTEENQNSSGFYFDNYLFEFEGKMVHVHMVAWQKAVFDKNRSVLKRILASFAPATEAK